MAKRKVLICGATGFIGRNITERFARRDDMDVTAVYNKRPPYEAPGVTWVQADLTDRANVETVVPGMDVIIQAAATTTGAKDIIERPYIHVTDNAVMNSHILRSAFEHSVEHILFFSCSVMYQSSETPVKESDFDPNVPIHDNYFGVAWTKVYLEKAFEFYARLGRTRHTILRNSNIYGPHDKFDLERSHVFGATMTKVLTSIEDSISVWGEGRAERDLLYVSDLVNLVETATDNQETPFELVNAGRGTSVSVRDLVRMIIECSGRDLKIEYDLDKPNIDTRLCLDISRAEEVFGWRPSVSLEEGIQKTMDWHRENGPFTAD